MALSAGFLPAKPPDFEIHEFAEASSEISKSTLISNDVQRDALIWGIPQISQESWELMNFLRSDQKSRNPGIRES